MRPHSRRILVVSDNSKTDQKTENMLKGVRDMDDMEMLFVMKEQHFKAKDHDVVLLAKTQPNGGDGDFIDLINLIKSQDPTTQIIYLVSPEFVDEAVETLKFGTFHYAKLPVSNQELSQLIEMAYNFGNRQHFVDNDYKNRERCDHLVGNSLQMRQVYCQIHQAASTDIPVLLLGETGTGKDLTAQAIHRFSMRSKGPYLASNLGAMPVELAASELFGHEKGSFTGAGSQRIGLFEQAVNGTLFLDEIEAIDQKMQISLLRVLEEDSFSRLGGLQLVENNARLIAACNQNLEEMVEEDRFREDLFYRLDVFCITLPPLRERPGDIRLLVKEFLREFGESTETQPDIDSESLQLLEAYNWPGNVRELKNVIHRAMIVSDGKMISSEHLPQKLNSCEPKQPTITFEIGTPIDQVEREMIVQTLKAVKDNRKHAAKLLGISRRAIYNKFEKHSINPDNRN